MLLSYCSQSKLAMMAGDVMRRAVLNVCSRRIAWTTSSIGGRISWTSSSVGARIWPTHTETAPSSSHHFLPWTVSPVRTLHLCANLCAGHNKWSKVKNIKGPKDEARARIFTKFGLMIRIAVKEGGTNPDLNVALAHALEQCRNKNMPKASIEAAIKSAEKNKSGTQHSYEARGPGGCAMLIDILTDNTNRSLAELKNTLHRNGGALADGARHNFNRKGVIVAPAGDITSDRALELAIEAGAEDVQEMEDEDDKPVLQFICDMKELKKVRTSLEELGIQIISAGLEFVAHKHVCLAQDHLEGASVLIEALNNCSDVVRVWDNIQAQS